MPQSYKIFIKENALMLTDDVHLSQLQSEQKDGKVIQWDQNPESILGIRDSMESGQFAQTIIVVNNNIEKLKEALFSDYEYIEAAGGVVINSNKDILFIYRKKKWDLPKGKIDHGERKEEAAIREVKEETGLSEVELVKELIATYHTFTINNERILKKTYWFEMKVLSDQPLKPQTEEEIEIVKWFAANTLKEVRSNTYNSIEDVLASYLNQV